MWPFIIVWTIWKHSYGALGRCNTLTFSSLEVRSQDLPFFDDLVDGISNHIVKEGHVTLPHKPGLGVTLNKEAVKKQLMNKKNNIDTTKNTTGIPSGNPCNVYPY